MVPECLRKKADADADEADVDVAQKGVAAKATVDEATEKGGRDCSDERDEEVVRDGPRPEA